MTVRAKHGFGGWLGGSLIAGGLMVVVASASGQAAGSSQAPAVPDAQVESNVLRALAGAPDLSTQNIQTTTVYGTVTLTGNVHDDTLRTKAENLVARVQGVKKVVDQMTLGDTPAPATAAAEADPSQGNTAQGQPGQVLMSDGTYGPPAGAQPDQSQGDMAQNGGNNAPPPPSYNNQGPPQDQQQGPPPQGRQPMYGSQQAYAPPPGVPGGQRAGIPVTIPAGAMLRIRINRGLTSNQTQPGTAFDGVVLTDVIADGAVAIPRGATVQGTVVDAKKPGVFKGQGELTLQLTNLTLGGRSYPLQSQVWNANGKDKTTGTVNNTVGTSAVGALIGAIAGGGEGAAIGAGAGAAAGLAGSAASPRGQVVVPPESVLTFTTAQPTPVQTVSEAEMQRLSYAAGPGGQQRPPMRRYYSPYYGYYYAPAPAY
jgi:hypothetical protein